MRFQSWSPPTARQPSTTASSPRALGLTSGTIGESSASRAAPPRRSRARGRCRRRARSAPGRRPRRSPPARAPRSRLRAATTSARAAVACRRRGEDGAGAAQHGCPRAGRPGRRRRRTRPTRARRAGVRRARPVALGERQERDLAGRAVGAAVELAVEDEPHPDSGADGDEREGRDVSAVAVVALGDRGRVDVVLDRRPVAEEAPEVAQHRRPLPARQVRRQLERAAVGLDDARAADHRLEQGAVARRRRRRAGARRRAPPSSRTRPVPLEDARPRCCGGRGRCRRDRRRRRARTRGRRRARARIRRRCGSRRASALRPRPPVRAAGMLHELGALEARKGERDRRLREARTTLASSPRDTARSPRICSSSSCSLSVRISLGRAAPVLVRSSSPACHEDKDRLVS